MAHYDFAKATAVRLPDALSSVNRSTVRHRRRKRHRAALGAAGTLFVLMGVAIGVLTLRFILVFAHSVLQ
jgi:hypothetical protein